MRRGEAGRSRLTFTMCNPPFYASADSLAASAALKQLPPAAACTGTATEMVYEPGGELGFATRMLHESLVLHARAQWYSTLFGKLSSVSAFTAQLRTAFAAAGVGGERDGNWTVTEMAQGPTKRWAVAWSFCDRRPAATASSRSVPALKGCFPPVNPVLAFGVPRPQAAVEDELVRLLATLDLSTSKRGPGAFYGEVRGNVWSRAARRALARGAIMDTGGEGGEGGAVKLGFLFTLGPQLDEPDGAATAARVSISWKRGFDGVLFESFCGMVRRKLLL